MSAASDLLLILSPPIRLLIWLEKEIAAKRQAQREVPEEITRWLERWQTIRSHLPSEIDHVTVEEWQEASEIVDKALATRQPSDYLPPVTVQAELLRAGRKREYV